MAVDGALINGILLAAGLGTRLRPLTEIIPKPLIPVCNQPMLDIVLANLKNAGVDKIAVNTHHLSEQIASHVADSPWRDDVTLFHEPEILGTGGGPVNASSLLAETGSFIIHNSDILTDLDLKTLLREHAASGKKITMALVDGPENKVRVGPDGTIHDILDSLGRAPASSRMMTYSGVMALHRDIFNYLPRKPVGCSIIKAILRMMAAEPDSARAYIQPDIYWNDLGTLPQYFKAHHDIIIDKKMQLPGFDGESVVVSPGAEIAADAELDGFVTLGENARIASRARLINCIVLGDTAIKSNDFHCNELIVKDFSIHRDFAELRRLKILDGVDLQKKRLSSLQEQGSARGFYRLSGEPNRVLMVSDGLDQDFERFIYLGRFLGRFDFSTPKISSFLPDEFTILMEDLGNDTLFRAARCEAGAARLEELYRQVIDALADFQLRGTELFKREDAPILRNFDRSYLRWESIYFSDRLLGDCFGVEAAERSGLNAEFDLLAETVDRHPKVFMHRDFQSQNIMLHEGRVRFVDFQGARMGPLGYDIMSLINDPYMSLPTDLRRRLERYFIDKMATEFPSQAGRGLEFCLVTAGLQRNLQALGAYGYLGLTAGKKHYLDYIPCGLAMLEDGLTRVNEQFGDLLRLDRVAAQVEAISGLKVES